MRRIFCGVLVVILLAGVLHLAFNVLPVKAQGTIYIRPDGSVDPATKPIQRSGNLYTFIADISDHIVVEKSGITLDGQGHVLFGTGAGNGIQIEGFNSALALTNITIRNMTIQTLDMGVKLRYCNTSTVSGVSISSCSFGVGFLDCHACNISSSNIVGCSMVGIAVGIEAGESSYNSIVGNNVTSNWILGVVLQSCGNCLVSGNSIAENGQCGVQLTSCSGCIISGNTIENNYYGVSIGSNGNWFFHNNVLYNTNGQVQIMTSWNIWDDGYPSGGNYWSDYGGMDSDGDGIGDVPYVIDSNNRDNYPLIDPYIAQIPGDINKDGAVDIFDCVIVALAFGSKPGDLNWNTIADINSDNIVDIFDMVVVALHFGETS